jgi:DNA ligase (NAD+)
MEIINKIKSSESIWEIIPQLSQTEIENVIAVANDKYYNGDPILSDQYYDILVEKLKILYPDSELLKNIGAEPTNDRKVKLPYWMGSMNKIKSDESELKKWQIDYDGPYIVSDKLDGISCLMVINDNDISLFTRGNGEYGQNITFLIKYINCSCDKLLSLDINIAIRGELIISKKKFENFKDIRSNGRNMVGGIVNSKPDNLNKKQARAVDFVAYEIIKPQYKPTTQFKKLKSYGLNVAPYEIIDTELSIDYLISTLDERKKKSAYEIDGIVITNDSKYDRNVVGNPLYSFAFKGLSDSADTKVLDIIWEPSVYGYIIPTIHYEKVRLSHGNLEYAQGFHAKYVCDNFIGKKSIITIIRSGDTIPHIIAIKKKSKNPLLPDKYEYHWDKNHVHIILDDPDNDEIVRKKRIQKFTKVIGVKDMSIGTINKLFDEGYDTIEKILKITIDDMMKIKGFQKKLSEKIFNNIKQSLNNVDIVTLCVASSLFGKGFGETRIKKIIGNFPDIIEKYDDKYKAAWVNKLLKLDGFEKTSVNQFVKNVSQFQEFYKVISNIINVKKYVNTVNVDGKFKGMKIAFTDFRDPVLKSYIESQGGTVTNTVTANTNILVHGDGKTGTQKYKKAVKYGINIYSKSEFEIAFDTYE